MLNLLTFVIINTHRFWHRGDKSTLKLTNLMIQMGNGSFTSCVVVLSVL